MAAYTSAQPLQAEQRLKNRLQGIGVDGGFLTSPMTTNAKFGNASPCIADDHNTMNLAFGLDVFQNDLNFGFDGNENAGLGMAGLQPAFSYASPMQSYKENIDPALCLPEAMACLSPPGTLRSKKVMRDFGPLDMPNDMPTIQVNAAPSLPSPVSTRAKRNRRQLSVRTNFAPSTPKTRGRTVTAPATPISSHTGNFDAFGNLQVPFNTPAQPVTSPRESAPFTYTDLYNYGLVQGSTFDLGDMGSPMAGTRVMGTKEADADEFFLGSPPISAGLLPAYGDGLFDLSYLPTLPTPPLDDNSCFSSPATNFSFSPMLSPAGVLAQQQGFGFDGQSYLMPQNELPQTMMNDFTNLMDPAILSDPGMDLLSMQEALSPSFSVPNSPLDTLPPSAALDAIADINQANTVQIPIINAPKLRHKRSRFDFEEDQKAEESEAYTDGADEGEDEEYAPRNLLEPPSAKKLRAVSAPVGRRLKPGPKPRKQPSFEGRRSISAGPGPAELIAQAMRNLGSDQEGDVSDDAGEAASAVPKSVIRSLYSTLPAHVAGKSGKKYRCLIEGCNRVFPRKSAIESHIQTHLEDKPFICTQSDCNASFVRQHDLRRHERIHSGNKPFPCPCGKGFARGDALMRHRQRGICVGSIVPRRG